MATRSFIAYQTPDRKGYEAIYCHWDGYPQGVGLTLRDHYTTLDNATQLVWLGDISSLKETVEDTAEDSYSMRGDAEKAPLEFKTMNEMIEHYRSIWCEYGYIFMGDEWTCLSLNLQTVNLYELEAVNV